MAGVQAIFDRYGRPPIALYYVVSYPPFHTMGVQHSERDSAPLPEIIVIRVVHPSPNPAA